MKGKITYKTGKAELHDLPCSGHTVRAVSSEMLLYIDAIIHWDKCITICQLALNISTSTEVLVTLSMILDIQIFTCVQETLFFAASWVNTKPFSSESGFHFQQEKRSCLAGSQVNQVGG